MKLDNSLEKHIHHIKKTQIQGLKRLNIETVRDLLYHFPTRYTDAAADFSGTLVKGETVTVTGTIEKINKRRTGGKRRVMIAEARINTGEGKVRAVWFNQPYIAHQYNQGDVVDLTGKVAGDAKPYLTNPIIKQTAGNRETEDKKDTKTRKELMAIYPETRNISSLWLNTYIEKLLAEEIVKNIEDPLPEKMQKKLNLPKLYNALIYIHKPRNQNEYEAAKKRFIFEKTLMMQITQQTTKNERLESQAYNLSVNMQKTNDFMKERFEFTPTKDQKKTVKEILKDIHSNKPMARLLEGDVGSGKTAVAAAVMHGVVSATTEEKTSGKPQSAYLAPTEVLARQQFNTLVQLFNHLPIQIGFIGGKECLKYPSKVSPNEPASVSKTQLKKWIASGEIAITVGTHAIIQKDIQFKRLALLIIRRTTQIRCCAASETHSHNRNPHTTPPINDRNTNTKNTRPHHIWRPGHQRYRRSTKRKKTGQNKTAAIKKYTKSIRPCAGRNRKGTSGIYRMPTHRRKRRINIAICGRRV